MSTTAEAATASVAFLRRWCGQTTRVVTAIDTNAGFIATRGFAPADEAGLRTFIEQWSGRRNLYFAVNPDRRAAGDIATKSRKSDVVAAVGLQADIDCYKGDGDTQSALRRLTVDLPPGVPGPASVINDSGNGLQGFWLLRESIPLAGDAAIANVESRNRGLQVAFGGDAVTDINRIMRLPWTMNIPNKTKRDRGLVPVLARQISFDAGHRYDLDEFAAVAAQHRDYGRLADERHIGAALGVADLDELEVPDRTKLIIKLGAFPGEHREGGRSSWLFTAIMSMVRCGEPDEVILGVITDPTWGISESVLEKPDPERYARRQIARAHSRLVSMILEDFDD